MPVCFLFKRRWHRIHRHCQDTCWFFRSDVVEVTGDAVRIACRPRVLPAASSRGIPSYAFGRMNAGRLRLEDGAVRATHTLAGHTLLVPPGPRRQAVHGHGAVAGQPFRTITQGDYVFCMFESNEVFLTYDDLVNITL